MLVQRGAKNLQRSSQPISAKGLSTRQMGSHLVHMPVSLEQAPDMLCASQRGPETVPDHQDAILFFSRTILVITILCHVHSLPCPVTSHHWGWDKLSHVKEPYRTEIHERSAFLSMKEDAGNKFAVIRNTCSPRFMRMRAEIPSSFRG